MFCTLLRKWQSFIYVFPRSDHWLRFAVIRFPYQIWVSRLRGLPVPSFRFPEKLVSVALLKESAIAFTTGLLQPSAYAAWIYRFIQHKHYIHHRMCEHGLSSDLTASDCRRRSSLFFTGKYRVFQPGQTLQNIHIAIWGSQEKNY